MSLGTIGGCCGTCFDPPPPVCVGDWIATIDPTCRTPNWEGLRFNEGESRTLTVARLPSCFHYCGSPDKFFTDRGIQAPLSPGGYYYDSSAGGGFWKSVPTVTVVSSAAVAVLGVDYTLHIHTGELQVRLGGILAGLLSGTDFTITAIIVPSTPPPSHGVGEYVARWQLYVDECGCPHMITAGSGLLTWGDGDVSDKTIEITSHGHGGTTSFWACSMFSGGAEVGYLLISGVSGTGCVTIGTPNYEAAAQPFQTPIGLGVLVICPHPQPHGRELLVGFPPYVVRRWGGYSDATIGIPGFLDENKWLKRDESVDDGVTEKLNYREHYTKEGSHLIDYGTSNERRLFLEGVSRPITQSDGLWPLPMHQLNLDEGLGDVGSWGPDDTELICEWKTERYFLGAIPESLVGVQFGMPWYIPSGIVLESIKWHKDGVEIPKYVPPPNDDPFNLIPDPPPEPRQQLAYQFVGIDAPAIGQPVGRVVLWVSFMQDMSDCGLYTLKYDQDLSDGSGLQHRSYKFNVIVLEQTMTTLTDEEFSATAEGCGEEWHWDGKMSLPAHEGFELAFERMATAQSLLPTGIHSETPTALNPTRLEGYFYGIRLYNFNSSAAPPEFYEWKIRAGHQSWTYSDTSMSAQDPQFDSDKTYKFIGTAGKPDPGFDSLVFSDWEETGDTGFGFQKTAINFTEQLGFSAGIRRDQIAGLEKAVNANISLAWSGTVDAGGSRTGNPRPQKVLVRLITSKDGVVVETGAWQEITDGTLSVAAPSDLGGASSSHTIEAEINNESYSLTDPCAGPPNVNFICYPGLPPCLAQPFITP